MSDFEKMIREMVANGAKMEDIAKVTGDTLNSIQKEQNNWKTQRQKRYEELETEFHEHYEKGFFGPEDIGRLAVLVISPSYPNWKVEDIDEFEEAVVEMVKMRAEMVGKTPMEGIMKALDMAAEWSKERTEKFKSAVVGKDKDTVGCSGDCGTGRKCTCKDTKTDTQRITEFLRDLGIKQ